MNEYVEVYLSIHSFFYGPHINFWKENVEDIIGIKRFKLLSKDNNGWFP